MKGRDLCGLPGPEASSRAGARALPLSQAAVQWGYRMKARRCFFRQAHPEVGGAASGRIGAKFSILDARGYGLVEPLITIVLAGILFVAMVPLFVLVIQKNSADQMRNAALNLAQAKIESIRSLRYDEIATANLYAGGEFWQGRFGTPASPVDIDGDGEAETVTSEVINGKTLFVHYEVVTEPADAVAGTELYKLVTVQTGWQGPPGSRTSCCARRSTVRLPDRRSPD